MDRNKILDEIISGIDADEIKLEFVVMAKVTNLHGVERLLQGDELETVFRGPERRNMREAKLILDVPSLKRAINGGVLWVAEAIDARVEADDSQEFPAIENKNKDI